MHLSAPIKQLYYEKVWEMVRQIPYGKVCTYGQIGKLLSQPDGISGEDYRQYASRWVGLAMAACPDDVPWQRVVNSQGKISPRAEPGKQKKLLEEEGILFLHGKLDLNEFQWLGQSDKPLQDRLF